MSHEFSFRETHSKNMTMNVQPYSYVPGMLLALNRSGLFLPFCNTENWPPEGIRNLVC